MPTLRPFSTKDARGFWKNFFSKLTKDGKSKESSEESQETFFSNLIGDENSKENSKENSSEESLGGFLSQLIKGDNEDSESSSEISDDTEEDEASGDISEREIVVDLATSDVTEGPYSESYATSEGTRSGIYSSPEGRYSNSYLTTEELDSDSNASTGMDHTESYATTDVTFVDVSVADQESRDVFKTTLTTQANNFIEKEIEEFSGDENEMLRSLNEPFDVSGDVSELERSLENDVLGSGDVSELVRSLENDVLGSGDVSELVRSLENDVLGSGDVTELVRSLENDVLGSGDISELAYEEKDVLESGNGSTPTLALGNERKGERMSSTQSLVVDQEVESGMLTTFFIYMQMYYLFVYLQFFIFKQNKNKKI